MPLVTVEINKFGAGALDAATPLNLNTPGVIQNRVNNTTLQVTVPSTVALGLIDLNQLWYGTAPVQQGAAMLLVRGTATSSGGAYGLGARFARRSPPDPTSATTNEVIFQLLSANGGQYTGIPRLFPVGHLLVVSSGVVAGPHRIVMVLKTFADPDALSAA